jgi:hypothetical protein
LLIPIVMLVVACRGGGSGPTTPQEPTIRLLRETPCLTQPPADPGPVLLGIPSCEDGVEGLCPPLTPGQADALWTRVEVLEDYSEHAWRQCGDRADRGVPSSSGQGADAADP